MSSLQQGFSLAPLRQRKQPINSLRGCLPPPPQLYLPLPPNPSICCSDSQLPSCGQLSPWVHLIRYHFVFEEKLVSGPGPGEADSASANCQPCTISLILPWESQVIPLQRVSYQTAAIRTLWRHRQQIPGFVGPGPCPEHSSAILLKGRWSCLPFLIRLIIFLVTTARCCELPLQRKGGGGIPI